MFHSHYPFYLLIYTIHYFHYKFNKRTRLGAPNDNIGSVCTLDYPFYLLTLEGEYEIKIKIKI